MALSARSVRLGLLFLPLAAYRGRLALSVAAIALGVALGYGVQLINKAAVGEMGQAMRVASGTADLLVHGPRSGFAEDWYARLAALPETEEASPVVELEAKLFGRDEALRILGVDIFRAAQVQPELTLAEGGEALDFLRPGQLFLSRSAAEWLGRQPGQPLQLQAGLQRLDFTVAGVLSASAVRQRVALMDIAAAQAAFGRLGLVSRVEIKLRPGVDAGSVAARLREMLPPGVLVERPEAAVQRNASLTRAYRINLNVLALMALFTGGLLVFSTQMLAVVRRRSEIALLRALGMTRRGVMRQLLSEAAWLGAVGAAIGIVLGHAAAGWVLAHYGADLGAGHFRGIEATPAVDVSSLVFFGLLGVLAALAGTGSATLEAARADPAAALRAGDEERAFTQLNRTWPGMAMLALGLALMFMPPLAGLPIGGYVAIALLLFGTLQLMPRLSRDLFMRLPLPRSPGFQLAIDQLRGAPGQTGVSLAAIVASVSLMASMAIMVYSFRQSLENWLERMLPADMYVRAASVGDTAFFSAEDERRIEGLSGVRRADFSRIEHVYLAPDRPRVALIIRDIEGGNPAGSLALVGDARPVAEGEPPPVWVSEAVVDLHGFKPGEVVSLPVGERSAQFTVAGVWRDYARQHGAVVVDRRTYSNLGGDPRSASAAVWLAPGSTAEAVESRIRRTLGERAEIDVSRPGELREYSLRIFDRTFAVTYALEAVAVLIGLFALSSSFAALALARRREFGVLRHLGMTRSQVGAMLAFEGTLVSALGLAVGLALGWLISLVLIHVVNRQSFHWSMDLSMPWLSLAAFVAIMLPLASLTAWAGARMAMSEDAVRAVKDVG